MLLPKLYKATLVKRYKRFLVDILLDDTRELVVAHCPNSGSMIGLINEGITLYVSETPNNKLKYKLELIKYNNTLIGINTMRSNHIVYEALSNKDIKPLSQFNIIRPEIKYNKSRLDFLLKNDNYTGYLEVKNVTLARNQGIAEFPDAQTQRGTKHIGELISIKNNGMLATNLYLIQREDVTCFKIAKDIDKQYYEAVQQAKQQGVLFLCYNCSISLESIVLKNQIEIID